MNGTKDSVCDVYFTSEEYLILGRNETFLFPLIAGVLIAFGFLDNCAFLFVVSRVKTMYTVTNVYLANIALADMGLLSFEAIALTMTAINNPRFDVGFFAFITNWACKSASFFVYTAYFGNVFFVTVALFDRYMSICNPLKYRVIKGKKKAVLIVSALWLSAFIMSISSVGVTNPSEACIQDFNHTVIATVPICHWYDFVIWSDWVKISLDLGQYLVTGAMAIFMIIRIIKTLSSRSIGQSNSQINVMNVRNQVARVLMINVIFFLLCYVPFKLLDTDYVIGHIMGRGFLPNIHVILGWSGRLAMLLNSSLNPILYNMTSRHFRNAYREAFCL